MIPTDILRTLPDELRGAYEREEHDALALVGKLGPLSLGTPEVDAWCAAMRGILDRRERTLLSVREHLAASEGAS